MMDMELNKTDGLKQFLAEQAAAQKQADSDAAIFEEWLQHPDPKPVIKFEGYGCADKVFKSMPHESR